MHLIQKLKREGRLPQMNAFLEQYFQLEILGEENLPSAGDGPVMLVSKHAPFLQLDTMLLLLRMAQREPNRIIRPLAWRGFLRWPLSRVARGVGARPASITEGVQILRRGESLLIYPEGIDAGDPRKEMNHFHSGFLRMLAQQPVPVIPIGHYGFNESLPWMVTRNSLLVEKLMKPINPRYDYLAIPKSPLPRPVKIVFNIGEAVDIPPQALQREAGIQRWKELMQELLLDLCRDARDRRERAVRANPLNQKYHEMLDGSTTLLYRNS